MIKKLKCLLLILIFTLGLGSICFAGKSFSSAEFEKMMQNFGYGDLDLDEFSFTGYSSKDKAYFLSSLSNSNLPLTIFKCSDSADDTSFSNTKFLVTFDSFKYFWTKTYYGNTFYYFQSNLYSSSKGLQGFLFDLETKSVYAFLESYEFYSWIPFNFYKKNHNITEEEWNSNAFRTLIFEDACLFSDHNAPSTNYVPQGGKITSSSYEDTSYTGSISYGNSTKTASITYTSGFSADTYYDIFLERYRLDNESSTGTGISAYPTETIDFGDITTTDTSKILDLDFALGSNNVYRLCIGINKDGSGTSNTVLLSTDWLIPNNNTLGRYPIFAQRHYYQFLDLVAYSSDYGSTLDLPYIISASEGYIDSISSEAFINVYCNIEYDIDDYYLTVYKQDVFTGELLETVELSPSHTVYSSLWTKVDDTTYHCNLENFYTFDKSSDVSYTVKLFGYTDGYLDATLPFYFKSNFGSDNEVIVKPISIVPYFINEISGRYNTAYNIHFNLEVADISGDSYDINDYKFLINTYSFDTSINELSLLYEHVVYFPDAVDKEYKDTYWKVPIRYLEVFEDGSEYLYKIHLADNENNIIDSTDTFYFLDVYDAYFGGSSGTSSNISEFNVLYSKVTSKFGFIDSIKSSIVDFEDIMKGIEPVPSISIDVGATKYTNAKTITVLDLNWYSPYKEYVDIVLTGFIYLGFLWRVFISLPSIINGAGGAVQSQVYVDDISAYSKFGFGRGDGKKHTYPTGKRR